MLVKSNTNLDKNLTKMQDILKKIDDKGIKKNENEKYIVTIISSYINQLIKLANV